MLVRSLTLKVSTFRFVHAMVVEELSSYMKLDLRSEAYLIRAGICLYVMHAWIVLTRYIRVNNNGIKLIFFSFPRSRGFPKGEISLDKTLHAIFN